MKAFSPVVVSVLGATSGVTTLRVTPKGIERGVLDAEVPWAHRDDGRIYWDPQWLQNLLGMLSCYARRGILAMGIPGADVAITPTDGGNPPLAMPHYRGFGDADLTRTLEALGVDKLCVYLASGGANVAPYQPLCQMGNTPVYGMRGMTPQVITTADFITRYLTMENGRDADMATSQGLTPKIISLCRILPGFNGAELFPGEPYQGLLTNHHIGDSLVRILPCSHDSIWSRMWGYWATGKLVPWNIWTGSWCGWAYRLNADLHPSAATFHAGISFEGADERKSAIANIALIGPAYKALLMRGGLTYRQGADLAVRNLSNVKPFDITQMPADVDAAADFVLGHYGNQMIYALPGTLFTLAHLCRVQMDTAAAVLGVDPPVSVSITGGFAENGAFLQTLQDLGFNPIVPPHAGFATHMGLAARAIQLQLNTTFAEACHIVADLKVS